jgi:geranylgeranyl pyrophosphate synthase
MVCQEKLKNEEKANGKIMEKVLVILAQRSAKALKQARKELLKVSLRIQSPRARKALKYYEKNWNDVTHPGILSLACEAVGGNTEIAIPMQVAMLLLSAATDLHDDIIDRSKLKNGKPTVFGKFREETTLLIGDALLFRGFILLQDYVKRFPPKIAREIFFTIDSNFFEFGNAHLREIDLKETETLEILPDEYFRILERKGSTIEMHARLGAIIGGGSKNQINSLGRYGRQLGTLIAIREEFIDIFEPEELQNRIEGKYLPLPILYALNNPKVKEIMLSSSQSKNYKELSEKLVEVIFADREVKKLIEKMRNISEDAIARIDQMKLKRNLRYQLSLLVQGAIEDLL